MSVIGNMRSGSVSAPTDRVPPPEEGSGHDGRRTGEDAKPYHGTILVGVGVVGVDVTDVRQGRRANHGGECSRDLGRGDLAISAYEPFQVMTLSRGRKPEESPARSVCRGAGSNRVKERAPRRYGRGRIWWG